VQPLVKDWEGFTNDDQDSDGIHREHYHHPAGIPKRQTDTHMRGAAIASWFPLAEHETHASDGVD
jgi:hypothetical protein